MQSFPLNSQRSLGDAVNVENIRSIDQGHNFSDSLSLKRTSFLPIERRDQEENIHDRLSLRTVTDIDQIHQLQDTQEAVISHEDNHKNKYNKKENSFQKNIFLKNKSKSISEQVYMSSKYRRCLSFLMNAIKDLFLILGCIILTLLAPLLYIFY